MSYRIDYGCATPMKYCKNRGRRYIRMLTAVSLILFALAVGKFWPQGRQVLREYLLPGEPSVTEQAFFELVSDLSEGMKIQDALLVFCEQIIDHGAVESN